MKLRSIGLSVAILVCAFGCDRKNDADVRENKDPGINTNEPSTNAATAVQGANKVAVDAITNERCAREQRCENVGSGKKYDTTDSCQSKTRADWKDDLNQYECPGGIVQKELDECLEEIRNEDCNSPLDTLGRVAACRSSDICKAT